MISDGKRTKVPASGNRRRGWMNPRRHREWSDRCCESASAACTLPPEAQTLVLHEQGAFSFSNP